MKRNKIIGIVFLTLLLAISVSGYLVDDIYYTGLWSTGVSNESLYFVGGDTITKYIEFPKLYQSYNASLTLDIELATIECYQETANESTVCGGLDTGVYNWTGYPSSPENTNDGDYATQGGAQAGFGAVYYANYTVPNNVSAVTWQVDTNNYSIPVACYDNSVFETRVSITTGLCLPNCRTLSCNNGTNWQTLDDVGSGLYEEGVYWDITDYHPADNFTMYINGTKIYPEYQDESTYPEDYLIYDLFETATEGFDPTYHNSPSTGTTRDASEQYQGSYSAYFDSSSDDIIRTNTNILPNSSWTYQFYIKNDDSSVQVPYIQCSGTSHILGDAVGEYPGGNWGEYTIHYNHEDSSLSMYFEESLKHNETSYIWDTSSYYCQIKENVANDFWMDYARAWVGSPEDEPTWSSFNSTVTLNNFQDPINGYLNQCTEDGSGNCLIPIEFGSNTQSLVSAVLNNITYSQYFANWTFNDSVTGDEVVPSCTLGGVGINQTTYNTSSIRQQLDMECSIFGYSPFSEAIWLNDSTLDESRELTPHYFNLSIYEEVSNNPIIGENISISFISDDYVIDFSTNDSTLYETISVPSDYTIRINGDNYGRTREYYYTLTNQSVSHLRLYLINDSLSTETTVTVYDQSTLKTIEGTTVYIQRYFVGDEVYRTTAMYTSDLAGKAYFDMEHDNEYYKILVDYPYGTNRYTSDNFYVSETDYNVYIYLIDSVGEDFFSEEGIGFSILYDNTTQEFTASWSDSELYADNYCLDIKKYGAYSLETLNSSCSSSPTGSIDLGGLESDVTNYAVFYIEKGGEETILGSSWEELVTDELESGDFGVFMTAVIVVVFVFMISLHWIALILGASSLVFAKMLGIFTVEWAYIFGIMFGSIILALIINIWKK